MATRTWNESPAELLVDHTWARRLARQLVHDSALADDLVQEACVRALERPPAREPRAWFGGIVRNLARDLRRERGRRTAREAEVARAEAQPPASEALERLAAQQDVVRAVLALEEPYRSAIVLRFYEGLPPRKIAARTGVPVATVKTRLARALAQLRAALDREHGNDGRSWALALLPLARGSGLGPILGGTTLMSTLAKSTLAAAALVLLVWFVRREPRVTAPQAEVAAGNASEIVLAAGAPLEPERSPVPRESAPPSQNIAVPGTTAAMTAALHGRVIDVEGNPVANVELGLRSSNGGRLDPEEMARLDGSSTFGSLLWSGPLDEDGAPLATSAADGSFSLVVPPETYGRIVTCDPHWEGVAVPTAREIEGKERVLVVAPRIGVAGVVRDASGAPLAGVELRFGVPRSRLHVDGVSLEDTMAPDWSATSDAEGRFELARLPAVPGAILRARLEPYEPRKIEREQWSDDELEIVLERAGGAWLEGVVEAGGNTVAGAYVALGGRAAKTDARGAFQLPLAGHEKESELCAVAAGFLPARISGDANPDGTVRWPAFVHIQLSGQPLALSGIVVDAEGHPLADQEVWLGEGREILFDAAPFLLESVLAGERNARCVVRSGADGRFELRGLQAREYALQVVDPRTALRSEAGPFAAGRSDLRLVQPTDRLWPVVRGVVVSGSGEPVPGLDLFVERDMDFVGAEGTTYFGFDASGSKTETDEHGAFELHDVPRDGVRLTSYSMEVVDPAFELAPDIDPLAVRIVVDRWVELEVHLADPSLAAAAFAVLDAAGNVLEMECTISGGISRLYRQPLAEGRSQVVKVNDRAAFVVLYAEDAEVARQAVSLRATGVNRVDF